MWTSIRMKRLVLSMIRCCSLRATYYCMQANFLHYVLLVQLWANSTNNMNCSTSKSEPHNINCLCGIGMKLEFIRFIYNSALTLIHSVVKRTSVVKRCQSKRWQKHRVCYRFRIMPVFSLSIAFFSDDPSDDKENVQAPKESSILTRVIFSHMAFLC